MTKGTYFATIAIVFAVAAGAMGASLASNGVEGSSSAKYPMLAMAKAVLREQARAIQTTSEVLTVNLTNMVILLVVKAIIFGFGFFGAGRRSANSPLPEIQFGQTDFMMMASYALGSTNSNYDCLYRTACEEPEAAHQYMTASKMLLKGVKMISKGREMATDYEDVLYGIQEAIEFRNSGGSCRKHKAHLPIAPC